MTLRFREDGTLDGFDWTSIGRKLTKLEVDENFATLWVAILALQADLADGVGIDDIAVDDPDNPSSFTITLSDTREFVVPLPLAAPKNVGPWMNGGVYNRLNIVDTEIGQYILRIQGPYTAPAEGDFDPEAMTDGDTDNPSELIWDAWGAPRNVNYDVAVSIAGALVRDPDDLVWQEIIPHAMTMAAGSSSVLAYVNTPVDGGSDTEPTALELSIEKNGVEIGTIVFAEGANEGTVTFASAVDFVAGDRRAIRATQADDASAADLSVTMIALRTDI